MASDDQSVHSAAHMIAGRITDSAMNSARERAEIHGSELADMTAQQQAKVTDAIAETLTSDACAVIGDTESGMVAMDAVRWLAAHGCRPADARSADWERDRDQRISDYIESSLALDGEERSAVEGIYRSVTSVR